MIRFDANYESESLKVFFGNLVKTIDGIAFLFCSVAAILWVGMIFFFPGLHDNGGQAGKLAVLAIFTPLILFFLLIRLRQLPWAGIRASSWFRAVVLVFVFFLINF